MAENPVSTRPPLARKPHRYKVDEGLDVRFLCHANSTHVLQTLWRGLARSPLSENKVCGNPLADTPALLLQDSAYSCRVWIILNKPLYAPLQHLQTNPDIHLGEAYAVGCYLRHDGYPRRTLIGDSRLHGRGSL